MLLLIQSIYSNIFMILGSLWKMLQGRQRYVKLKLRKSKHEQFVQVLTFSPLLLNHNATETNTAGPQHTRGNVGCK